MRRFVPFLVAFSILAAPGLEAAVRGDKAMYIGGTVTAIPEKKQGKLDTSGDSVLVFHWDKESKWEVPFKSFTRMEYGQKAGRRVGAAVMVSPLLLFSKKRKHYLTLHYKSEGQSSEAVVFELSKGTYQQIISTLEAKTGLKTEYETEEAKKEK